MSLTVTQIQNISGAITDLAKSAQLNASDQGYVLRARNEIAQLSSLLISYSLSNTVELRYDNCTWFSCGTSSNPHFRAPKQEHITHKEPPPVVETPCSNNKRKHKSITSQGQYCRSCGTTQTPEWRRGPDGGKSYVSHLISFVSRFLQRTSYFPHCIYLSTHSYFPQYTYLHLFPL